MNAKEVKARLVHIEDDELRDQLSLGVRVLTKRFGQNWPDRINTDTLNMRYCYSCVIGQLMDKDHYAYREWTNTLSAMGLSAQKAYEYGFDVHIVRETDEDTYDKLNDAWKVILCG